MQYMRIYESHATSSSAEHLIYRLSRLLRMGAASYFRENQLSITPEQWGLLLNVAENQGCLQNQLADRVLNDHPNVTKMLDGLQKQGLIKREQDPDDRRRHAVYLTEGGKALLDELLPDFIEHKETFFEGFNRSDIEKLVSLLQILEKNLTRQLG
jgi:MarR family transcriptional regulator for hemolysin